jgi:hypothetical protein
MNQSKAQTNIPRLTLGTALVDILPLFNLSENDWENAGGDITLSMLGSESLGLTRERGQSYFNDTSDLLVQVLVLLVTSGLQQHLIP